MLGIQILPRSDQLLVVDDPAGRKPSKTCQSESATAEYESELTVMQQRLTLQLASPMIQLFAM